MRRDWLITVLGIVFVIALIGATGWWLGQVEEDALVHIRTPLDMPELGVSIYAQFVVTQTMQVSEPSLVTRLELPLYFSSETGTLLVTLLRNENLVQEWQHQAQGEDGIVTLRLSLDTPQLLDGLLEVRLAAPDISHEQQEEAPRVLVESDDEAYPDGNYRIADNQKKGDVGLTLVRERQRWERLLEEWRAEPLEFVALLLGYLAVLFVVALLPGAVWSSAKPASSGRTTPDTT